MRVFLEHAMTPVARKPRARKPVAVSTGALIDIDILFLSDALAGRWRSTGKNQLVLTGTAAKKDGMGFTVSPGNILSATGPAVPSGSLDFTFFKLVENLAGPVDYRISTIGNQAAGSAWLGAMGRTWSCGRYGGAEIADGPAIDTDRHLIAGINDVSSNTYSLNVDSENVGTPTAALSIVAGNKFSLGNPAFCFEGDILLAGFAKRIMSSAELKRIFDFYSSILSV